jgi:aquaporin Z
MNARSLLAEALGTALLVFLAVGVATLSFGYRFAGSSYSAGVVTTALAFGVVLLVLVYAVGPISGCHINPAVTMGFLVSGRMSFDDALAYWVAQFVGGIAGAAALFGVFHAGVYSRSVVGLGTNGYGSNSSIKINAGGAFAVEVILTFVFVFVILAVTRRAANAIIAGVVIGLSLTLVHLIGIPIDGTSVNPARSLGPALFVGSSALKQIWVFILAPLVGGALAALVYAYMYPEGEMEARVEPAAEVTPGSEAVG